MFLIKGIIEFKFLLMKFKNLFLILLVTSFLSCTGRNTLNNQYNSNIPTNQTNDSYYNNQPSNYNNYVPTPIPSQSSTLINPILSNNNEKILFMSNRDGFWDIYSMNSDGSEQNKLTQDNMKNAYTYSISPDGRKIAYISDKSGKQDLWVIDIETKASIQATNTPNLDEGSPSWLPDGKGIAFHVLDEKRNLFQIEKIDYPFIGVPKSKVVIFDEKNNIYHPSYSPDGRNLLYTLTEKDDLTVLYLLSFETKKAEQITTKEEEAYSGSWSPDSKTIVFWTINNGLFQINNDGSNKVQLGTVKNNRGNPIYSPDGKKIIISRGTGLPEDYNVWSMDNDGKNMQKITSLGGIGLGWFQKRNLIQSNDNLPYIPKPSSSSSVSPYVDPTDPLINP